MQPKYSIKKATIADVDWIAKFQLALALESENIKLNLDDVIKGVKHIFNESAFGFYVIAKNSTHNPIGSLLILKEWSDWRNAEIWWIHSVYISPEYRRQGLFQAMFKFIEDMARNSGVRGLRLYVDKTNETAKTVYSKLKMNNQHYELFEKMF